MKIQKKIILCFSAVFIVACSKVVDNECIFFLGDSIVARWNVEKYFPDKVVENKGKGAAHVDYIEEYANRLNGKTIVVLIGTNDLKNQKLETLDEYVERYFRAIKGLNAMRVYLYCVFPRSVVTDDKNVNQVIRCFNKKMISRIVDEPRFIYIDVYNQLLYNEELNPQYSFDGVHLNSFGYELLSNELRRVME